jgi:glycosyltransferase involved in cell wall biosynthesis
LELHVVDKIFGNYMGRTKMIDGHVAGRPGATISVLTPSLNQQRYIAEALDSAVDQAVLEHIVVDGGSTDGALDVIRRYPEVQLHVMPGLDSHEAINWALRHARGDIVGVLNTDDRYEPGALRRVADFMAANPEVLAVCGGIRFFSGQASEEKCIQIRTHLDGPDMMLELTFGAPAFNSWFFRRSLVSDLQGLRPIYHFSADREFLLRVLSRGAPVVMQGLAYHFRVHAASRTMRPDGANRRAIAEEHVHMAKEHVRLGLHTTDGVDCLTAWWAYESAKLVWLSVSQTRALFFRDWVKTPWFSLPRAFQLRRQLRARLG